MDRSGIWPRSRCSGQVAGQAQIPSEWRNGLRGPCARSLGGVHDWPAVSGHTLFHPPKPLRTIASSLRVRREPLTARSILEPGANFERQVLNWMPLSKDGAGRLSDFIAFHHIQHEFTALPPYHASRSVSCNSRGELAEF